MAQMMQNNNIEHSRSCGLMSRAMHKIAQGGLVHTIKNGRSDVHSIWEFRKAD